MSIKRYICSADASISNFFKANLRTRVTSSNFGAADICELFSIYGQASTSSVETMRILAQFPVSTIVSDRAANVIPASGSVNFYLRMFNAPHGETLPRQFTLVVSPVSRSWIEGAGLDLENGDDISPNGINGANWLYAASASAWTTAGGDYLTSPTASQYFDAGTEDLEVNITPLVEQWVASAIPNYGVGVALSSSHENQASSFYTKKFFARSNEFFYSRPTIEVRWDSSTTDDRGRFFISSSLLDSTDNAHTIYLYNYVNGQLKNIASVGSGSVYVSVYTSASNGSLVTTTPMPVTGGYVSTGIYSASFALATTERTVYDVWFSGSAVYHTGSITPIVFDASNSRATTQKYITAVTNLKNSYSNNETTRVRLFIRENNWHPNLFSIASENITGSVIQNAYYKVMRTNDQYEVVPFGTGSTKHTKLSYDGQGNFFDFDMSMLEKNYLYEFRFAYDINGNFEEAKETFKFRIK